MADKYCLIPDKNKYFDFLSTQALSERELINIRSMSPERIIIDTVAGSWKIEYKSLLPVSEELKAALVKRLIAAFNLKDIMLTEIKETRVLTPVSSVEKEKKENNKVLDEKVNKNIKNSNTDIPEYRSEERRVGKEC